MWHVYNFGVAGWSQLVANGVNGLYQALTIPSVILSRMVVRTNDNTDSIRYLFGSGSVCVCVESIVRLVPNTRGTKLEIASVQ